MVESAKKANEGRSAANVPEAKGLAELLDEINVARNPWLAPNYDWLASPLREPHAYARVADDVQALHQAIEDRDKVLASVRSEIENLIAEVPALQQRAQAVLDEGGHRAELQRAELLGRISVRQGLRDLLKRFEK
jgi:hypothetical protein